jgi:hypothetical protein
MDISIMHIFSNNTILICKLGHEQLARALKICSFIGIDKIIRNQYIDNHLPWSLVGSLLSVCLGELSCIAAYMLWVQSWFVAPQEFGIVPAIMLWLDYWFMVVLLRLVTIIGCYCTSSATTLLEALVFFEESSTPLSGGVATYNLIN